MRFNILYYLAIIKGFLVSHRHIELYRMVRYTKNEVRELCEELQLDPVRIIKGTVKFRRRK